MSNGASLLILLMVSVAAAACSSSNGPRDAAPERVRVMTLNVGAAGENVGRAIPDILAVVRASDADLIGLQEVLGRETDGVEPDAGRTIAAELGWNYLAQSGSRGILTRHTIVRPSAGGHGARLRTHRGRELWVFNVHLPAAPYQPYQLLGIPYEGAPNLRSEAEAIASARLARGKEVDALVADILAERAADPGRVAVVTGDFNEPSRQDWTAAAARAGRVPLAVAYPSVRALTDMGFTDAFRAVHPDPLARPGHTWTPITEPTDPNDRHDRIDFVLIRGAAVEGAIVVGEKPDVADLVVTPWPTDHRGVLAVIRVGE